MKHTNTIKIRQWIKSGAVAMLLSSLPLQGQAQFMVGMGDSIGEGVQGGDAAWQTQVYSYLAMVNAMIGGDLTLPYINSGFFGVAGDTSNRTRISENVIASNVAVSGASVYTLINERPAANTPAEISTEAELVLYPRKQTQLEYVEASKPILTICWIGNNDVLSAATSYGALNATQMTPLVAFDYFFTELATRLGTMAQTYGRAVVFANIPNVTDIGFLINRATAEAITGFPVNLPDGYYTTIIAALLMSFEGNDALVSDPGFVLDPAELSLIEERIQQFNAIIQREADRIGMPVVDINAKFAEIKASPPVFYGKPLSTNILGGLFSLDGIHPSNLGNALVANEFVRVINDTYGTSIPLLSDDILNALFLTDPSTDKDGDGKATGRLGVGLLETLAFIFGITGDSNDFVPGP